MATKKKSALKKKKVVSKKKKPVAKKKKTIILSGSEVQTLFDDETLEGYEDFEILDADYNTGEFMSSKSAMVDFEICLHNKKTDEYYTGIGGYYNEGCGYQFSETSITFKQD